MKRIPKFRANIPIAAQLTHQTMNAIVDAIEERTPTIGKGTRLRQTPKGFAYSADPGSGGKSVILGFKVTRATSSEPGYDIVKVRKSVILGLTGIDAFPKYNGEDLTDAEIPVESGSEICIRIEIEPGSQAIAGSGTSEDNPPIYELSTSFDSADGFTVHAERIDAEQVAEIDPANGNVVKNGIYYLPLATIGEELSITQYVYGPVSATYCSGRIIWQPPVIFVIGDLE